MKELLAELRRRNVFKVGVAYALVAWLLIEVAHTAFPTLQLPDWTITLVTVLLIMGFPVALVIAWAFELTPEGIKRAEEMTTAESITHLTGRKLDFAIIGLLAIAVIFLVVDNYILGDDREKSIAVLPFANISLDPEDAYFADGIHDEILAQLSKIRDLKVISRTSVMSYREENRPPLPEIATKLGVANILEGSVRLAGNRVRITIQLIEAASDAHLWTETYDRELTAANIFSIQSDVATTVAEALRAALSPEEQDRLASAPTENLAAYEAYLLGRQRLARLTAAASAEAVEYFQQAIELDPEFALAYAGLADSYVVQVYFGGLPSVGGSASEEGLAKAQAAADKALALDDQLGEVYKSLAGIKHQRQDLQGAEAMYRRALELNPNYAMAHAWYGDLLRSYLGRPEEALALHKKAADLDPLSVEIITSVGMTLESLGRFDEALARYQRAIEINPAYTEPYIFIGDHYWSVSGRIDEAVVWHAKGISLDPDIPRYSSGSSDPSSWARKASGPMLPCMSFI
jgi:TolB-like protein